MDTAQIIEKLKECRALIPEFKQNKVHFRDDPAFDKWKNTMIKWLRIGLSHTQHELEKVEHLRYELTRMRMGQGYDFDDELFYQRDLDKVQNQLDSAIENLELGLTPEPGERHRLKSQTPPRSSVSIGHAQTVVTGDQNVVKVINQITVSNVLEKIEREVDREVKDEGQRQGLRAQIHALAKHPAFAPILTKGLGTLMGIG